MRIGYLAVAVLLMTTSTLVDAICARGEDNDEAIAKEALIRAGMSRKEADALFAWTDCLEAAADRFAAQPEPAKEVAEAAMAACTHEENIYEPIMRAEMQRKLGIKLEPSVKDHENSEKAMMPDLLARIMSWRASHPSTSK